MVTKNISFCDKRHSDVFVVQHVSGIFSGICSGAWLMLKQKFQCSFFCHPSLGWLCCIASYDGLKIKKMENISS
ncbi:hypothetical protein OZD63_01965, partial [Wolbachia endosymbiont of Drosophila leontia]|nr:hypothetical protein [Wolbachia endosymbiont of Drosophila leontia]